MPKVNQATLFLPGQIKALTLGLLLLAQSGCQLLPDGSSLLPNLKAAQLEPDSPPTREQAAAQSPRTQDAEAGTPAKVRLTPSAEPSPASPKPAVPQPKPVLLPTPVSTPSAAPTAIVNVAFLAQGESELSSAYPVRLSLEDGNGKILGLQEIFPAELAQGIRLASNRLIPGDVFQVRVQGQVLAGKCLTNSQFLLKGQAPDGDTMPSPRLLTSPEQNLSRADFVAQPGSGACKTVLTVYGQVLDPQGDGIAGVALEATLNGPARNPGEKGKLEYRETTFTDNQGHYTLKAFPPGVTVHLSASQGGYVSTEKYLKFYYGLSDQSLERHDSLSLALAD